MLFISGFLSGLIIAFVTFGFMPILYSSGDFYIITFALLSGTLAALFIENRAGFGQAYMFSREAFLLIFSIAVFLLALSFGIREYAWALAMCLGAVLAFSSMDVLLENMPKKAEYQLRAGGLAGFIAGTLFLYI